MARQREAGPGEPRPGPGGRARGTELRGPETWRPGLAAGGSGKLENGRRCRRRRSGPGKRCGEGWGGRVLAVRDSPSGLILPILGEASVSAAFRAWGPDYPGLTVWFSSSRELVAGFKIQFLFGPAEFRECSQLIPVAVCPRPQLIGVALKSQAVRSERALLTLGAVVFGGCALHLPLSPILSKWHPSRKPENILLSPLSPTHFFSRLVTKPCRPCKVCQICPRLSISTAASSQISPLPDPPAPL